MPRRVALTGGIATGKSFVAGALAAHGFAVVDADALARQAVAAGSPGLAAVVARFGRSVLDASGALDRAALGRLVFADAAARRDLEQIVHPVVQHGIEAFFAGLPPGAAGVAEIPLLFETGRQRAFDVTVVTACRPATQVARLIARDGLSAAAAAARLAAQWPIEDKARLADVVILTEGSKPATERQVERFVTWLRRSDRQIAR